MSDERPDFTWEEFSRDTSAPREDARFAPCHRHADRQTGITCQRCGRPICGECMRPASVGFQCPECVGSSSSSAGGGRTPAPALAASLRRTPAPLTLVLVVASVLVGLVDLLTGRAGAMWLAFSPELVGEGELWRLVTAAVIPGGVLAIVINSLFLWTVGGAIESELGWRRMGAVALLAVLGTELVVALTMRAAFMSLQFEMLFGLLAAMAVIKRGRGESIQGDLILFGVLIVMNLGFGMGLTGLMATAAGLVSGALGGAMLMATRRLDQARLQAMLLAGAVAVMAVAVVGISALGSRI